MNAKGNGMRALRWFLTVCLMVNAFGVNAAMAIPPGHGHPNLNTQNKKDRKPTDLFGVDTNTERSNDKVTADELANELYCQGFLKAARDFLTTAKENRGDLYDDSYFQPYEQLLNQVTRAKTPAEVTAPSNLVKPVGSIVARWVEKVMKTIASGQANGQPNEIQRTKARLFKELFAKMYPEFIADFEKVAPDAFDALAEICP